MYRIRWGVGAGLLGPAAQFHGCMPDPFCYTEDHIHPVACVPVSFLRSPQIKSTYAVRELWEA